jgi:hypothetical protein
LEGLPKDMGHIWRGDFEIMGKNAQFGKILGVWELPKRNLPYLK